MTDWAADRDRTEALRSRRVQYETAGLAVDDVLSDPVAQWWRWHDDAEVAGVAEPNAAVVSTVGTDGIPDARILLVRGVNDRGLVFYTNYASVKGRQLEAAPRAAAVFGWLDLHRQVRVRGTVERVDPVESDAYFAFAPA